MIAHTSLAVSDYSRSKNFYLEALEPLGYRNNMEYGEAAGFNDGNNTDFWITQNETVVPAHVAFETNSRQRVAAFYEAALAGIPQPLGCISPRGAIALHATWRLRYDR